MRKFTGKPPEEALQAQTDRLQKQVDTQAETITRLNQAVCRFKREKEHWQNKYFEVVNKQHGGGKR